MKYDTTLKELLWRGAPALLQQLTGLAVLEGLQTEFPATRNRHPDFLARLADHSLFHLELQVDPQRFMPWRLLEYYPLISVSFGGQPVRQMVLALTDAAAKAIPREIVHPNLSFRFEVRSAADLDAGPLLASDHADDHVLAILCRTDDIRQRVRDILRRIKLLDAKERADAVTRLMILAGMRKAAPVVEEEAREMEMEIDIADNPVLMRLFNKAVQEAVAKVEAKAVAKAEADSEAKWKADMLLRQLERRFGQPVPEERRRQVQEAAPAQLDLWSETLLFADSLDSVFDPKSH